MSLGLETSRRFPPLPGGNLQEGAGEFASRLLCFVAPAGSMKKT
jgi:hypothetical protein